MPAQKLRIFDEGENYIHVYNKGVGESSIFAEKMDYEVFLAFLKDYLTEPTDLELKKTSFTVKGRVFRGTPHQPKNYCQDIELVAYTLAHDHFHLIVRELTPKATARFMKSFTTRYSIYFNRKYHKTGALFDRSYKSVQIRVENKLTNLITYCHKLHESEYSSRLEYLGERETSFMSLLEIPEYSSFETKYTFDENEKKFLSDILLERFNNTSLASKNKTSNIAAGVQNLSRIPEYIGVTLVFVVLLGLSVFQVSSYQAAHAATEVLSASISPTETPTPTPQALTVVPEIVIRRDDPLEATSSSENRYHRALVVVNASESGALIPIYKQPSVDAQKRGEVVSGQVFVLISTIPEWYEIQMTDLETAFIQAEYTFIK